MLKTMLESSVENQTKSNSAHCFIPCAAIGEGNLLLHCLQRLLHRQFVVCAVFSNSKQVKIFCEKNGITFNRREACIENVLSGKPVDYLFSISNPRVLSENILKLPREKTINYHDSLLPKYAGLHATSWAIINGETIHGITWHVVDSGIDTGDILIQKAMTVLPNDSALTLNMKCQEAAKETFDVLMEQISTDTLIHKSQSQTGRSYFGLYSIPPNIGVLSFSYDAEGVYNHARALEFGNHENALGSPKICTSTGDFLLVTNLEISTKQHHTQRPPGTILDIVDGTIFVSTMNGIVFLSCCHLDGSHLVPDDYAKLGLLTSAILSNEFAIDKQLVVPIRKREGFWRKKMVNYEPTIFFRQRMNIVAGIIDVSEKIWLKSIVLPLPQMESVRDYGPRLSNILLASFVAFLGRICCTATVCIGLLADKADIPEDALSLYADICPAVFNVDSEDGFGNVLMKCVSDLERHLNSKTFLVDMFYRFPELRGRKQTPHHNIVIGTKTITASETEIGERVLHDCNMLLLFSDQGEAVHIIYNERPGQELGHVINVITHFPTFIQSMRQSRIDISLSDVMMVSDEEMRKFYLVEDIPKADMPDSNVYDIFIQKCNEYKANTALLSTTIKYTYEMIIKEVEMLSCVIDKERTLTKKQIIGLHLPNSIAYVISVLAVLKTNRAFIPLPLDYPPERLAFVMQDAEVTSIITTEEYKSRFEGMQSEPIVSSPLPIGGRNMILVQFSINQNNNKPVDNKKMIDENNIQVSIPNDICYIMYTSGSTGKPKGVMVSHISVINLAMAQIKLWDLNENDNIAQFASIGFDASISEIFTALFSGSKLSILDQSERLGLEFVEAMNKLNVTTITMPPSALNIYGPNELPKLKKIISAGEACTIETAMRWVANGVRFFNAYGPTETTVCASCYEFNPNEKHEDVSHELPIGKKIQGALVYLFDDKMKPVPPNIIGEIHIGGIGLSRGYLGHAAYLNSEKFVPNPLSDQVTLYKTGDHAFQDQNGNFTYVGRLDDMLKIRGHRVDLSEIEQVIIQHPKIELAIVVAHNCTKCKEICIAAYVAPPYIYASELKEYLSKVLPKYMMPNFVKTMEISNFPTTINGKIDRKVLAGDATAHEMNENVGSSHLNEIQLGIAKLWCNSLKLDESYAYSLFRQSSFSELGGNSLQLVLLQRKLEDTFGYQLSFTDLGTADTIEEFEEALQRKHELQNSPVNDVSTDKSDLKEMILKDAKLSQDILSQYVRRGSVQFHHFHSSIPHSNYRYPKNILISGVTGFLGAYLLSELLEQTNAHICCMVRETTESRGLGRVIENMRKYNLWKFEYTSRIAIIISDLSKERLGIAPDIYNRLSTTVDVIFINAAKMNFNTSYEDHRIANVQSTKEFIKFAFTGVQKFIFLTSSISVFLFPTTKSSGTSEHRKYYESDFFEDPSSIVGGYGQSKWASESLVMKAIEHLPGGAIFRPARISGCSTNGIGPRNDIFGLTLIGMRRLGSFPDMDFPYDLTPVDYVAKASIEIAIKVCNVKTVTEKVYHLFNKYTMPFNEIFEGMDLRPLPLNTWREELKNVSEEHKELLPLTPFFLSEFWDRAVDWPIFDTTNTDNLISEQTKRILIPSKALLKIYKRYFGIV